MKGFVVYLLVAAILIGGLLFYSFLRTIPAPEELKKWLGEDPTIVYAADGVEIGQFGRIKGEYVPYKRIPAVVVKAVVATEDSRFFKHQGVDYAAIIRAFLKDLLSLKFKEGGSTITQQLAKMAFLSSEKTITRKIKEFIIALRLERELTKQEIMELYLNRAYFGAGFYGVESAARGYFGKHLREINTKEAALLAGLLRAPEYYSPFRNPERAEKRAKVVLKRMELVGYLKPSERKKAEKIKLHISNAPDTDEIYGYYLDVVKRYLIKRYGSAKTFNGGLRVFTTLRRWAQIKAVETLKKEIERLDMRYGWRGPLKHIKISPQREFKSLHSAKTLRPFVGKIARAVILRVYPDRAIVKVKGAYGVLRRSDALWARKINKNGKTKRLRRFNLKKVLRPGDVVLVRIKSVKGDTAYLSLRQYPLVQGAIVTIKPENGYVQALVGGYSYKLSQFNRAVSAKRQAGSVFKPFVYALALKEGYTPSSIIYDTPVSYKTRDAKIWKPMNYDRRFHGRVTLREALKESLNVATLRLAESIGVDPIARIALKAGFAREVPRDLSIALGTFSTSPLRIAVAYTVFPNNGFITEPVFVREIRTKDGRVLEQHGSESIKLLPPDIAYRVTMMLTDVVRDGTGRAAAGLARGVAGKTGTTDGYRDAWFVGLTPELVTVVWIGFDDNRSLGWGHTGGRIAAPIWKHYMRYLISGERDFTFHPPKNVVKLYKTRRVKQSLDSIFDKILWGKDDEE